MAGSSSKPDELPLTFGLEVEFLFGVRTDIERTNKHWPTLKGMTDPRYRSDVDNQYYENLMCGMPSCRFRQMRDGVKCLVQCECWEYDLHTGFWQAGRLLDDHGAYVQLRWDPRMGDECFEKFENWTLTKEVACKLPVYGEDLCEWTDGMLDVTDEEVDEWDWTGLELISPALRVPDLGAEFRPNGLVQVKGYLNFLNPGNPAQQPYVFIAHPRVSGVHVHMGIQPQLNQQVDIPLDVLRHLAYLCIFFEDTITLLHSPERHSYPDSKCRNHAVPNRMVLKSEHSKDIIHNCYLDQPFSPEAAFMKIFNYKYTDDAEARQELCENLSCRGSHHEEDSLSGGWGTRIRRELFVNFQNIVPSYMNSKSDKRTIEFRQHHGTKNPEDLEQWVVFLTALMRVAERLAHESAKGKSVPPKLQSMIYARYGNEPAKLEQALDEAAKYAHLLRYDRRSLKQLFDTLTLPLARRNYWWRRAQEFQSQLRDLWAHVSQSTCDEMCGNPPLRDCEGWEDGELDNPPWYEADEDCAFELDPVVPGPNVKEEVSEDESVPMEIENDIPSPVTATPKSTHSATPGSVPGLIEDDDSETEPMDIDDDDDVPSPESINSEPFHVVGVTPGSDTMSITHILNHSPEKLKK